MKIWKRNAVVTVVVLFVCAALYLSWSYGNPEDNAEVFDPAAAVSSVSPAVSPLAANPQESAAPIKETNIYFDEARLARQSARDDAMAILTDAAANEAAGQEIRDNANKEIANIAANALAEANIEGLITAKGYGACVAYINAEGVKVVVEQPENGLNELDANIIADIVLSECKVSPEDINVVPI